MGATLDDGSLTSEPSTGDAGTGRPGTAARTVMLSMRGLEEFR